MISLNIISRFQQWRIHTYLFIVFEFSILFLFHCTYYSWKGGRNCWYYPSLYRHLWGTRFRTLDMHCCRTCIHDIVFMNKNIYSSNALDMIRLASHNMFTHLLCKYLENIRLSNIWSIPRPIITHFPFEKIFVMTWSKLYKGKIKKAIAVWLVCTVLRVYHNKQQKWFCNKTKWINSFDSINMHLRKLY